GSARLVGARPGAARSTGCANSRGQLERACRSLIDRLDAVPPRPGRRRCTPADIDQVLLLVGVSRPRSPLTSVARRGTSSRSGRCRRRVSAATEEDAGHRRAHPPAPPTWDRTASAMKTAWGTMWPEWRILGAH